MASSACHLWRSREANIFYLPFISSFYFASFFFYQSRISETSGDSTNKLSQQVVWGWNRTSLSQIPKILSWGELGSKRAKNSTDFVVFRLSTV